ncbi:MAG: hypothetical protein Q7J31_13275 [Syntrophales bacterium]|nr:hypothetical protein [Syntrophales bacterium]
MECLSGVQIITTVVVAFATVVIAFATLGQFLVNRSKLRLDLYNKRFAIYSNTLTLFQGVLTFSRSTASEEERIKYDLLEKDFIRSYRESQFLFKVESNVYQLLKEFFEKEFRIVRFRGQSELFKQYTKDQAVEAMNKNQADLDWVLKFIDLLEKNMEPYLNFQKAVSIW